MRMKVTWSYNAIALLDDIYEFYREKSSNAAIRIYNRLIDSAEPLKSFPLMGPVEPLLEEHLEIYRSIVVEKHFKLIYTIEDNLIKIHAIWDCRQDNRRLIDLFK